MGWVQVWAGCWGQACHQVTSAPQPSTGLGAALRGLGRAQPRSLHHPPLHAHVGPSVARGWLHTCKHMAPGRENWPEPSRFWVRVTSTSFCVCSTSVTTYTLSPRLRSCCRILCSGCRRCLWSEKPQAHWAAVPEDVFPPLTAPCHWGRWCRGALQTSVDARAPAASLWAPHGDGIPWGEADSGTPSPDLGSSPLTWAPMFTPPLVLTAA